jgi:hypothetical protein
MRWNDDSNTTLLTSVEDRIQKMEVLRLKKWKILLDDCSGATPDTTYGSVAVTTAWKGECF